MHSFFQPATPSTKQTRELTLGEFSMPVPLCKLPDGSGYFLYFKLNDYPDLIEEAARLIAEHIASLNLKNPYFVTPEASTLALAHVLRQKYHINGATIYKTRQLTDVGPVSINYDTVTSLNKKMLYLGKERADEMRDKDIFILDSVCTSGGTIKGTYQLLLKAGIAPQKIVEATMLFTEGCERTAINVADDISIKVHSFGHLPVIAAPAIANGDNVFSMIA